MGRVGCVSTILVTRSQTNPNTILLLEVVQYTQWLTHTKLSNSRQRKINNEKFIIIIIEWAL